MVIFAVFFLSWTIVHVKGGILFKRVRYSEVSHYYLVPTLKSRGPKFLASSHIGNLRNHLPAHPSLPTSAANTCNGGGGGGNGRESSGDLSRGFPAQAMLFCQRVPDVKDSHACTIACAADAIFQASTDDEAYSYTCGAANNNTASASKCSGMSWLVINK